MIKVAIFDLDGTLVNTLASIAHFANSALTQFGYEEIPLEEYRYLVGNGADNLVRGMLKRVNVTDETAFNRVRDIYNKSYDDNFLYLAHPYQGIIPMLDTLLEDGIKLAVLSNKPDQTTGKIIRELFGDRFTLCYGKRDGMKRKPDPSGVHSILEQLNLSANECIYIGDTSTDMQTAHSAGVFAIGVLWGFRDEKELSENKADLIVEFPYQINRVVHP